MKKTAASLLSIAVVFALASCQEEPKPPTDKPLTIEQAKKMVDAYQDDTVSTKPVFLNDAGQVVQAFNVQSGTLDNISSLEGYTGIRLYLAVRDTVNGKPIYTLVVVPRGPKGPDGKYKNILKDGQIYDWTQPCPDVCPDNETTLP